MSEGLYRSLKLVLLAIFVFGSLYIGSKIAENGRYVQWDQQKDWGEKSSSGPMVVDTRNGNVYKTSANDENNRYEKTK